MGETCAVKLDRLTVRYGRLIAVNRLSLEVTPRTVYALLGRNGSGKSSTVRCMLGQRRANAGSARLFGVDAWRGRRSAMERVGVVPENPDIPPDDTAERVARFVARVTPHWRPSDFFSRLEGFRIPRQRRFNRLSKGQQRQLALALALAGRPRLLVLDDPTLGLDAVARRALFEELVGDLADRGTTVFLTSHDLGGIEGIADRVGILDRSRLRVDESMDALKARFCRLTWTNNSSVASEQIRRALIHLEPLQVEMLGDTGEAVVGGYSEVGFGRFREQAPVEVKRVDSLSLEDIFIALCGDTEDTP